jgi:predicted glycogen debranching enzyme
MDAKVEDWVVTPRDGKAVEINALWYNALKLLEKWLKEEKSDSAAAELEKLSAKVYKSFNKRFWNAKLNYLYDVIDGEQGDDCSCRPNQILAISLDYPVLDKSKWEAVIKVVSQKLLTPLGLRTLSQEHPHFKPKYFGDLRARDAAYHQGTVWAWLIGPFIDAWLKLHPNQQQKAGEFLKSFDSHLSDACIGSVSEIFDALDPFTPRGCIAQAWSVAEVLRSLVRTKT